MRRLKRGDWIRVTWMDGQPCAEVIEIDDYGDPIIEHPLLPGLGPMSVDVWEFAAGADDPVLFVGANI
jgi:hypothetical protein